MQTGSLLDRSLWPIVLTVAVVIVAISFAQGPLSNSGGTASAQGQSLTLWVTGGETASETEEVAHQLASCGELAGRAASVGVLSGGSVEAVNSFLSEVRGTQGDLLLLTSGVLSEVAYDERRAPGSEAGQLGRETARKLLRAAPVAVLADDPIDVAVRRSSPIVNIERLLTAMREGAGRPQVGIAAEAWLEGGLAALAHAARVEGAMPFDAYHSSREAASAVEAGEAEVALAPASALDKAARDDRLRRLPWPARRAAPPQGWIAIVAPSGLSAAARTRLRKEASDLCTSGTWRSRLRSDGLAADHAGRRELTSLISSGLSEAQSLQSLAASTVRDY